MNFVDKITIAGTHKRADGALIVDARTARTGIQLYAGYEVGRPDLATVRVFRSADEVFSRDTLASFAHRPVTNDHPNEPVTVDNWRDHAVGQTSDEVTASEIYVRVPLMVSDASAIKNIENGKRELSPGYSCDLDWTAGKTQGGEHYDAQQRNIRVNHIAIVDRGRSGYAVRIGDAWGVTPINDNQERKPMTKVITFDGIPLEVTDAAEAAIIKLQGQIAKLTADMQTASTAHVAALADKDKSIGTLTADLELSKKKIPDGAALDKMVSDRTALIGVAAKIVKDFKPDGLDNSAIRKAVVVAKLGDTLVKDRSDDQISAMFDAVAADSSATAGVDPFRHSMLDNPTPTNIRDNGQAAYEKRIGDAWKSAAAT